MVDRRVTYMLENGGIVDQEVLATRVSLDALSDTSHGQDFRYICTSATLTEEGVAFELGPPALMNQLLPKYRFLRYRCRFALSRRGSTGENT